MLTRSSYGGGGGYGGGGDLSGAVEHAQYHGGDSGDASMYSNVAGRLGQNHQQIGSQPIDEQRTLYLNNSPHSKMLTLPDHVQSHQQFYGGGGGGGSSSGGGQPASSSAMGSAAAMQALKMYTGGGTGNTQAGNSQNAFVGMAMGQASKLFDQQSASGNVASGASKESAIQQAAESALQM
jgi:hypothetical protein